MKRLWTRSLFEDQNALFCFALLVGSLVMMMVSCSENGEGNLSQCLFSEEDIENERDLGNYLRKDYICAVHQVSVMDSFVKIGGECIGADSAYLVEIPPYVDVVKAETFIHKSKLTNSPFEIELDRFVEREGILYDRLLSKWAVFKEGEEMELSSHARYADNVQPLQSLTPVKLVNKKGLGGIIFNPYITDFSLLNISSATINVPITHFMHLTPSPGDIEHSYGGKMYYMDENYLKNTLDRPLLEATSRGRNISVAAIILLDPASRCADPDLGRILQHPDNNGGIYTMPNMTTPESVNCYAAALDFLAKRYCTVDNRYGRIAHWIMHNEVDGGRDWANMGLKPVGVFTDTYLKSMRMCYNIVRQYDANAEVFASFSHSWTEISNPGWYTSKEIIDLINAYSMVEGDFQWGLAYHSYAQDLTNPCTWIDPNATLSMNTPFITFKNLEVLNRWALSKENKYKGTIKRSVWLSEAGVNSRGYSEDELQKQAAGFAYAWKKINTLEGIDGIQWHNWFDNEVEGANLGLRKSLDSSHHGEAKPVWHVYQKANTDEEDEYFEQFLPIIGISDWNVVEDF